MERAKRVCSLYTYPLSATVLPVYNTLNLTWATACSSLGPTVDLYLSVLEPDGLQPVHEWTGITYSNGFLSTQLKPSWWNATTGAGQVQAQLVMTPSGSPIWDTSAPSGPLFSISYNGT